MRTEEGPTERGVEVGVLNLCRHEIERCAPCESNAWLLGCGQMRKLTIVGMGLLGGSIGMAARERKVAREVVGFSRRSSTLDLAEKLGALDLATGDLSQAVRDADLVIFCTPMSAMGWIAHQSALHLRKGCLVTDVGSVKAPVVSLLEPIFSRVGARFVGSHPMAGSERSGVRAARADLFERKVCIVTPTERTHRAAKREVEAFWKLLGMKVRLLSPSAHDAIVARVSHLPHVVASALVNAICKKGGRPLKYAGPGFRDSTRVASSSPEMWAEICAVNRGEIGRALDDLLEELTLARRNLGRPGLLKLLQRAKKYRDAFEL